MKKETPLTLVQHQVGEQFPAGFVVMAVDTETGEPVFICEFPNTTVALALAAMAKQFSDYMERVNRSGMENFFRGEEGEEDEE